MYNEDYMATRMRAGRSANGGSVGGCGCGCGGRENVTEKNNGGQRYSCRGELIDPSSDQSRKVNAAVGVKRSTWGLEGYPLASVFAPLQNFCELYDLDTALERGTIFKQLDLPFACGDRSMKGGGCRG